MMNARRLYRTIESFASANFRTEKQLLKHVLNEIVKNVQIDFEGGRIWQYESSTDAYRLVHQIGPIGRIEPGYEIPVSSNSAFFSIGEHRSVLARETDQLLREVGITRFLATGVGEKIEHQGGILYQYVLSFNADEIDQHLLADLNIISLAVTSAMSGKRIEQKARLLEEDLDKAREIQQSILPEHALDFHHYQIYGVSIADRVVGGDFFDYLFADSEKDRLSVVIGDAASKGFRAAAQALYVVGALRMGINYHTKISWLMSRANKLVHQTFSEEQFVSMFYAELSNDKKGLMLYSSAGHNSPIIYRAKERRLEMLESTGQILGPFPEESYRVENTHIQPNDVVVLYTDGISEAKDGHDMLYGEKRLGEVIRESHVLTPKEICQTILDDVLNYSRGSEESDDRTIVVIKRLP